jgi:predicted exporter
MAVDWITRQYRFLERHRLSMLLSLAVLAALAFWGLRQVHFDNSLEVMLPKDSEALRTLRFLHDAKFSDKVVVSFELQDEARLERLAFFNAVDGFAAAAARHPGITKVSGNLAGQNVAGGLNDFLELTPQLLGPDDLAALLPRLEPEAVGVALRKLYMQKMAMPFSSPFGTDPLGVQSPVLVRLRDLLASFGYDVRVEGDHLVSRDGRHALVLLDTSVKLTDAYGSRDLLDYLNGEFAKLPAGMKPMVVCGHLHTIGNEAVIKRDIGLTGTAAGICFLLIFLLIYRDPRTFFVVMIPSFAVLIAINVCGLALGTLSYFIIGFGTVIAGITVDYGMHIYIAVRHCRDGVLAIRRMFLPVLAGMLSMLGVFAAFFVSAIPGYRQLAWFAVISIAIAFSAALLILPHLLSHEAAVPRTSWFSWNIRIHSPRRRLFTVVVFTLLVASALWSLPRLHFDSRLTQLDGTPREVFQAEEDFQKIWGHGESRSALLVMTAPDYEQALQLNDAVYQDALKAIPEPDRQNRLASLARLWPSARQRSENLANWRRFWSDGGRRATIAKTLAEKSAANHFSATAFTPFLNSIDNPSPVAADPDDNLAFSSIKDRFVRQTGEGVHVLIYFPDEEPFVSRLAEVARRHAGTFLISRQSVENTLSGTITGEITKIALAALLLVLLAAFSVLRSPKAVFVAMLPVLAGGGCFFAVSAWLGRPLNIANLIAGVVVVGMCFDYGVFILHSCMHELDDATGAVVTLNALVTLCGDGVLLFAHHPILFSLGLTLVTGVTAGYLVAVFVVPDVSRMLGLSTEAVAKA